MRPGYEAITQSCTGVSSVLFVELPTLKLTDCTKLGRIVFQIKILLAAKSKPFRKLYAKIFLLQLIGILIVTNEGWKREKTNPQIKIFEVCLPILLRLCCPTLYCAIPK